MTELLVIWLLSALSLLIVAHILPGIEVESFPIALAAALVIGLVNSTVGFVLKVITFPFAILTLGLSLLVINALMLKLAAAVIPGFRVNGCLPAILGSILLTLVNAALRWAFGHLA